MIFDWKVVTVVVAVVASFTVLAVLKLIPEMTIVTIVSSVATYVLGLVTNPKKKDDGGGSSSGTGIASAVTKTLAIAMFVGAMAISVLGCAKLFDSNVPSDIQDNYACVQTLIESGVTDVAQIELRCAPGQIVAIIDVIETLLSSKKFVSKHPELVPVLRRDLTRAKATLAAKEPDAAAR